MLSTPPGQDTTQQPKAVIDPEIILAARADRVSSPQGAEAARRAERQGQRPAEIPVPAVDTRLRVTDAGVEDGPAERSSITTWVIRTVMAVGFAVCSAVAAAAWQTYGDQAQEVIARWIPHISLMSTPTDKTASEPAAQQASAEGESAPADAQQPPQPAPAAAPAAAAPAAVADAASDQTQLLQSMAHDLAAMGQQISDLKASIAQLKTGQDQLTREVARLSEARAEKTSEARPFDPRAIEQTLRPRPAPRPATAAAGALPTPAPAPVHRPRPTPPPAQSVAAPPSSPAPIPLQSAPAAQQVTTDSDGNNVVRPPMPVR
ncbi:conserved hypothetical protein [Bradyrhizobium sp. STM 3843]|uniref:hypothetical protein n=1 Tax=Bradyrhizobium sp. STM 3843 TaxID=551947 RepID=UPI0002404304|nr:hypothetical protein [Bradyrhizobium sp. STM 3843]CCE07980.1 conserved hypothetical protein [Bradyrhizobium sp. STM 3843]